MKRMSKELRIKQVGKRIREEEDIRDEGKKRVGK